MKDENVRDTRIVYGMRGTWWDSIDKVGHAPPGPSGHSIPICPCCGSPLFEMDSIEQWWAQVDAYEAKGHPGYRAMTEWGRGKCFQNMAALEAAYADALLAQREKKL